MVKGGEGKEVGKEMRRREVGDRKERGKREGGERRGILRREE